MWRKLTDDISHYDIEFFYDLRWAKNRQLFLRPRASARHEL